VTGKISVNICFYGLNRSLGTTIYSLNKSLFGGLSSIGVEFKAYGFFSRPEELANTRSGEFGVLPEDNEAELIKFDELGYIDQGVFDDTIPWAEVFEFGDFYEQVLEPSDLLISDSSAKNIFRSLFCLKSSYGLVPDERRQYPTIFLRPDLEILSEIDWSFYLSLLGKKPRTYAFGKTDGVALVPTWHSWDGFNDRFAICTPGNASSAYANRFDGLLPYIKMTRKPIHPESFLLHLLQASHVEILPLIAECMSRIRGNCEPQNEDFAQGAKIYSTQTETLSCLHKLLKESRQELERVKEDYDITMKQLLQVQEELEQYYFLSKGLDSVSKRYLSLTNRCVEAMTALAD